MILSLFRKKASAPEASAPDQALWREEDPDVSVVDPATIAGILEKFVKTRSKLAAQGADGNDLGLAVLLSCDRRILTLRVTPSEAGRVLQAPLDLNLAGATAKGAILFPLRASQGEFSDLWQAEFPRQMVQIDSRRYRRIKSIRGPVHYASLTFAGAPKKMKIIDLSEEGVEMEVTGATEPDWPVTAGTLMLDQHKIHVPAVQRVRVAPTEPGAWRVGVSLQGIEPAAMRILRRWLNAAETSGRTLT